MILLSSVAFAAEWVVGTDAADFTSTVALAASGDTVRVPDGTWAACVDLGGRSLTITGSGTLDGTGCDYALRAGSGETVSVDGVTFTNPSGRGLVVEWSTATLTDVTFQGAGRSDWSGGAIYTYGAALTTESCTFEENIGWEGGAIYHYAYTTWQDRGSRFANNRAASGGGAVFAYYDNALTLSDTSFEANSGEGYYGGAIATWNYTDLTLSAATFTGNTSVSGGGAVFYYPTDSAYGILDIRSSTFSANTAPDGGALWVGWAQTTTIADSRFDENVASSTGGALLAYVTGSTTLTANQFCENAAATGGAVSVQWTTTDTWTNNVFAGNTAQNGGGGHRYASYAGSLWQNSFVGNTATSWGGAYYASWGYADMRNNLVAHNGGAGLYASESASFGGSTLAYNGFAANDLADAAGYFYASDGRDGAVVTDEAGLYAWDPSDPCGDVRLAGSSPMKDAGDPALLDPDGTRSDIGAWGGPGAPVVDLDGDGYATDADCDDTSTSRHPGAAELCDGADDDCDGVVDNDATDAGTWYTDADGDGYGGAIPVVSCGQPTETSANNLDCDDNDPWSHPDASDLPGDGVDADCSGADNTQEIPAGPSVIESPRGCAYVDMRAPGTGRGVAGGLGPTAPLAAVALLTLLVHARTRRGKAGSHPTER